MGSSIKIYSNKQKNLYVPFLFNCLNIDNSVVLSLASKSSDHAHLLSDHKHCMSQIQIMWSEEIMQVKYIYMI